MSPTRAIDVDGMLRRRAALHREIPLMTRIERLAPSTCGLDTSGRETRGAQRVSEWVLVCAWRRLAREKQHRRCWI